MFTENSVCIISSTIGKSSWDKHSTHNAAATGVPLWLLSLHELDIFHIWLQEKSHNIWQIQCLNSMWTAGSTWQLAHHLIHLLWPRQSQTWSSSKACKCRSANLDLACQRRWPHWYLFYLRTIRMNWSFRHRLQGCVHLDLVITICPHVSYSYDIFFPFPFLTMNEIAAKCLVHWKFGNICLMMLGCLNYWHINNDRLMVQIWMLLHPILCERILIGCISMQLTFKCRA